MLDKISLNEPDVFSKVGFINHRCRGNGFTLIELLVVIAIIAILASTLFPVFSQAKAASKKTQCLSNMNQNALGITMYTQDSDGFMPIAMSPGGWPPVINQEVLWPQLVQPYTKNWDIMRCPIDSTANDASYLANCLQGSYGYSDGSHSYCTSEAGIEFQRAQQTNFGYNCVYLSPWPAADPSGSGCTVETSEAESSIARPSHMVLGVDPTAWYIVGTWPNCRGTGGGWYAVDPPSLDGSGSGRDCWNGGWTYWQVSDGAQCGNPYAYWNAYGGLWPGHQGLVNVAYVDTHAKSQKPLSLMAGVVPNYNGSGLNVVVDQEAYLWGRE